MSGRRGAVLLGLAVLAAVALLVVLVDDEAPARDTSGGRATREPAAASPGVLLDPSAEAAVEPLDPGDGAPSLAETVAVTARVVLEEDGLQALTITGRVVDASGRPFPDVRVVFLPDEVTRGAKQLPGSLHTIGWTQQLDLFASGVSDENGRFVIGDTRVPEARRLQRSVGLDEPSLVAFAAGMAIHHFVVDGVVGVQHDVGELVLDAPGGRLVARVVGIDGQPVAGARCLIRGWAREPPGFDHPALEPQSPFLASHPTDADGIMDLSGLWPGTYKLHVLVPEHVPWIREGIAVPSGTTVDLGLIQLDAGGLVSGVVNGPRGQPLAGAEVFVVPAGSPMPIELLVQPIDGAGERGSDPLAVRIEQLRKRIGPSERLRTDADGRFAVQGLEPGNVHVYAGAAGFEQGALTDVPVGTTGLGLALSTAATATVRVVDAVSGAALAAISVRVLRRLGADPWRPDELLRLELAPATPGEVFGTWDVQGLGIVGNEVEVSADGYATTTVLLDGVEASGHVDVVVRLLAAASLRGRVLAPDGTPLQGATVSLTPPVDLANLVAVDRQGSDADGVFLFSGLAARAFTLRVTASGCLDLDVPVGELKAGDETVLDDIQLVAAASVFGTVRWPDGSPAGGQAVRVSRPRAEGGGITSWPTNTDAEGHFLREGLPPGAYTVRAEPGAAVDVTLAAAEQREAHLQLRHRPILRGRVTAGGQLAPKAQVHSTVTIVEQDEEYSYPLEVTFADQSGAYEIALEQVGHYTLHARSERGGRSLPVELDVSWDEVHLVDFDLGSATVGGRVSASGEAVPLDRLDQVSVVLQLHGEGAVLQFDMSRGEYAIQPPSVTPNGPNGTFRFEQLLAGTYVLAARGGGYARTTSAPIELEAGQQLDGVVLDLSPGGRIEGTLLDAEGHLGRGQVYWHPLDEPLEVARLSASTGRFTLDGLAAGTFRLVVADWRYPDALKHPEREHDFEPAIKALADVTLAAGEVRALTLRTR